MGKVTDGSAPGPGRRSSPWSPIPRSAGASATSSCAATAATTGSSASTQPPRRATCWSGSPPTACPWRWSWPATAWRASTSSPPPADEPEVRAPAVVLATGVAYRRLGVPDVEALMGRGVAYGAAVTESGACGGDEVVVVGGGNSAGQAALQLAQTGAHVSLLTRRPDLADTMSRYLRDAIDATPQITVRTGCAVVGGGGDDHLSWLELQEGGTTTRVRADELYLFLGGEPRTAWLPDAVARDGRGFVLTGAAVADAGHADGWLPTPYETSVPGVYAVGDVRAGSVKRVASAVGEGSVVVPDVYSRVTRIGPPIGVPVP